MKDDNYNWEYYNEFIRYRYVKEFDTGGMFYDYYFEVYRKRWWRFFTRKWEHSITTSNYQLGYFISESLLK